MHTEQRRRAHRLCRILPDSVPPDGFFYRNVRRLTQKQRAEGRRHRGWESRTCSGAGMDALRLLHARSADLGEQARAGGTTSRSPREKPAWNARLHEHARLRALDASKPPEKKKMRMMKKKQSEKSERRGSSSSSCGSRLLKVPRLSPRVPLLSPPQQSLLPHASAAQAERRAEEGA